MKWNRYTAKQDAATLFMNVLLSDSLLNANNKNSAAAIINGLLYRINIAYKGYMSLMLSENAWFVKSYLGMFLFAPVMNAFIESASKKQIKIFLLCFFVFQSIYGWISTGASFISGGYSSIICVEK